MKARNVELIQGDLNNADTYRQQLRNAHGVFSVQTFENGVEKEIKQGITLASETKEAGVKHFLYSSIVEANLNSGVPHFESKLKITSSK